MAVIIIVLAIVAVAAIAIAAWLFYQRRRSGGLREQFGPEYDRAVRTYGDRDRAEKELRQRREHVEQLQIRPLSGADRSRFSDAWRSTQAHFVDDPAAAINDADRLIGEVMEQRGYPVGDFEARAADLSVDHPAVVSNYRAAHRIALANREGGADTEDLRQAMVHYRSLFDELLGAPRSQYTEVRS